MVVQHRLHISKLFALRSLKVHHKTDGHLGVYLCSRNDSSAAVHYSFVLINKRQEAMEQGQRLVL